MAHKAGVSDSLGLCGIFIVRTVLSSAPQLPKTFTHCFHPVGFRGRRQASPVIPASLSGRLPEYSIPSYWRWYYLRSSGNKLTVAKALGEVA